MYCIYSIYISIWYTYISVQCIYLFLMHLKCKTCIHSFGTVHSDTTLVILLCKQTLLVPGLALSLILSALS